MPALSSAKERAFEATSEPPAGMWNYMIFHGKVAPGADCVKAGLWGDGLAAEGTHALLVDEAVSRSF